ncbi:MAG: type II secretion system major pseudopilin GspG [Gammaproteobacteria bacterium]|nr:type II secretion system major pseudopilin GspG [Gammaproteobacteria bacterium]MCW5582900.1 type II secretion system major pseudopilin GspG [Gammaproteobacteria bacterium]
MRKVQGFTFFGVIVVIVLLGIAAYFIIPRIMYGSRQQQLERIKQDLDKIYSALNKYKLDNGFYPATVQGLDALVTEPSQPPIPQFWNSKGYLLVVPMDPWGQAYQYVNNYEVIRVYSYGSGGKGSDTEIDLSNVDR